MNTGIDISNWTLFSIEELEKIENDHIEFKTGNISTDDLKKKLSIAASAFSNTGGGLFIIGIDKTGNIDGIPVSIGKQPLRDWLDQTIYVEPMCKYEIKIIELEDSFKNRCVAIIKFYESKTAPHMAFNKIYYIRTGAHSVPASHYIVESIRLRTKVNKPSIFWRLVEDTNRSGIIRLVLFTTENQNAYNVKIDFNEYVLLLDNHRYDFPLEISVINKEYPFMMDMYLWGLSHKLWNIKNITLKLEYEDILGNKYYQEYKLDKDKALAPIRLEEKDIAKKIYREIKKIASGIELISKDFKSKL